MIVALACRFAFSHLLQREKRPEPGPFQVLCVPNQVVTYRLDAFRTQTSRLLHENNTRRVLSPKYLIHYASHQVDILVADLDEEASAFGEEFAGEDEAVAEVGEVGVDAEFPGVAEGADLFGLAGGVLGLAVLDVALAGGDLPVGAEVDAVGRVEVDHLDLALEALFFGEGGHDEEGVAEDEAVRPVLVVAVEIYLLLEGEAVEVGEEVLLAGLAGLGGLAEVFDEGLGLDFLLDVDGDGGDGEGVLVLLVLAFPDELGVEGGVAGVEEGLGCGLVVLDEFLEFAGGDVLPLVLVAGGSDGDGVFRGLSLGRHIYCPSGNGSLPGNSLARMSATRPRSLGASWVAAAHTNSHLTAK